MVQICNVEKSSETVENVNASVVERMTKKRKIGKNTVSTRKMTKKKKVESNKGKLQFSSYMNFEMRMPEKARKVKVNYVLYVVEYMRCLVVFKSFSYSCFRMVYFPLGLVWLTIS
jgi:hypothetical protein